MLIAIYHWLSLFCKCFVVFNLGNVKGILHTVGFLHQQRGWCLYKGESVEALILCCLGSCLVVSQNWTNNCAEYVVQASLWSLSLKRRRRRVKKSLTVVEAKFLQILVDLWRGWQNFRSWNCDVFIIVSGLVIIKAKLLDDLVMLFSFWVVTQLIIWFQFFFLFLHKTCIIGEYSF